MSVFALTNCILLHIVHNKFCFTYLLYCYHGRGFHHHQHQGCK